MEDAAYRSIREPLPPTVYLAMSQVATDEMEPFASITIRPAGASTMLLAKQVAGAIGTVDGSLSLTFRSLAEQVDAALAQERIVAMLSGFFGALALLLAGVGLYGVTSYAVGRRRTEIGIRMALGAEGARVVRLVLARVTALVALGIAVGALLSLWAGHFVGALLYGLEPRDPETLVGAALVLAISAAVAVWGPARRAARIDPAQVLREG